MTNPTTPSAEILEKVKELKKESENLEGHLPWCEDCVYDACRHISRNVDRDFYSSCTHEGMMFGYDGGFIARVCNAFPSIASLCLEQAEEIEVLRGLLLNSLEKMRLMREQTGGEYGGGIPFSVWSLLLDMLTSDIETVLSPSSHDN